MSPADELPAPVPASPRERPLTRTAFQAGDARAKALAAAGGAAKAGKVALAASLGLSGIAHCDAFKPYARRAASFRRLRCAEIAAVAGGTCGAGPSSLIATASLQLAASRYLYDIAMQAPTPNVDLLKEARQQGDSSRQNLLAAYELAVREAQRRKTDAVSPIDAFIAKQRAMREEEQLRGEGDGVCSVEQSPGDA